MSRSSHACVDCGVDTFVIGEWYMVQNALWKQAWEERPGQSERSFVLAVSNSVSVTGWWRAISRLRPLMTLLIPPFRRGCGIGSRGCVAKRQSRIRDQR